MVFGWVDGLSRLSLVCFDYLSTQPTEMPYYKLILYKHRKTPKYGYLAIYIEYNRNLGGSLVGWTDRQKNPALCSPICSGEIGKLFIEHPARKLVKPFSVSRSLVSFFVVGWIVDGDTTRR